MIPAGLLPRDEPEDAGPVRLPPGRGGGMTSIDDTNADDDGAREATVGAVRPGRKAWTPEVDEEVAGLLRLLAVKPWQVADRDDATIAAVRLERRPAQGCLQPARLGAGGRPGSGAPPQVPGAFLGARPRPPHPAVMVKQPTKKRCSTNFSMT